MACYKARGFLQIIPHRAKAARMPDGGLATVGAALTAAAGTFGAVYKTFATFDGDQSDEQRRFVRDWLLGLRVDDRGWTQFYIELFARFFGKKHFSWECLLRSSLLSSFVIVAIYAVSYVKNRELLVDLASVEASFLVMSLISAIIADYLSLWKTRLILTKLNPPVTALLRAVLLL